MIQNIMTIFEYPHFYLIVSLLFLFISSNPISFYRMWELYQLLDSNGLLPEKIASFPVHSTSMREYLTSQEKINSFISQACDERSCELILSTDDINNIYLRGKSLNKYKMNSAVDPISIIFKYYNKYFYFQIVNNSLFERRIEYITLSGSNGISTETRETRFVNNKICSNLIEQNDKSFIHENDWNDDFFYPVTLDNDLLYKLLTNDFETSSYDMNESKKVFVSSITSKIISIEIIDGCLVIKI
jgi:hypothetical protein